MLLSSAMLDKFEMKILYVCRVLAIVYSSCFFLIGIWLIFEKSLQDRSILFPLIMGGCSSVSIFRLNKILRTNNGAINRFQVRCCFFGYARSIFVGLVYLFVVTNDIKQAIGMGCITLFCIGIEILNLWLENKKATIDLNKKP